ncbi:PTS system fructose-specific EIIABC component [Treponema phagedenis F0421]|uniref:PTS sugar transporter subunit IIA n=1 Tax=Treponema phagedenis TaxID=162 RepID=UPI0001F63BA2|nr:PTS sugar transporter subunit IIA [Treponema phagedenis]EFW38529.1 PTS system fructose-specific EIIABC component [Treponema phagedenis F0421]
MLLSNIFSPLNIKVGLESEDKDELFEEMVDLFVSNTPGSPPRTAILEALHERENKLSTGIKKGLGLPHAKIQGLQHPAGVIGLSKEGIEYESLDGSQVHIVFMLLSTETDYDIHLRILKRLSLLLNDPSFLNELFIQTSNEDVYQTLCRFEKTLVGML